MGFVGVLCVCFVTLSLWSGLLSVCCLFVVWFVGLLLACGLVCCWSVVFCCVLLGLLLGLLSFFFGVRSVCCWLTSRNHFR